jgi:mannose-6-phosphate isomerase-like protein (cupin superfamily)
VKDWDIRRIADVSAARKDDEVTDVGPGSVIYVRKTVPHRFEEIERDLKIVVFAPCESG